MIRAPDWGTVVARIQGQIRTCDCEKSTAALLKELMKVQ